MTTATVSAPPAIASVAHVILRGWNGLDRTYNLYGASALIRGRNGAGKTALVDALRFAVTGTSRGGKRPEDVWRHARQGADEMSVTVQLAGGFSWTRTLRRDGDKLSSGLAIADMRTKQREAEGLLAAAVGALPAQFDLAGYHDLSPQAKRTFLLGLLGGADEDVDLAALVREAATVRLTAQEPGQEFPLDSIVVELARVISHRDASADLLALGEKARELVGARVAAHRETMAATRALQDQALLVAVIAGTAGEAEADLAAARSARMKAETDLATARERETAYQRATKAEEDARQALAVLKEAAEERLLFDYPSDEDRLRAALAEAQSTLDQARRAEEAARDSLRELDARADAACLELRAKEARASETRIASDAKKAVYRAAASLDIEARATLEALRKKIAALEHGPAAEALTCYYSVGKAADLDSPRWDRLGELIRAWAAVDELEQACGLVPALELRDVQAKQAVESAEGQADIWSDTAADAEIERREAEVTTSQAAEDRSAAALRLRDRVLETIAAEASTAAARGNLDAISVGQDDPGRDLALSASRHAEARASLDACPVPARPLAEFTAQALAAVEAEKSAQDLARAHQEAGGRARNLCETLERARKADLEHTVAVAVQRAVQDVRERWMAKVVAPLTEAMTSVVIDAWPPAPGCHALSVYTELETLHGHAAAEIGVVVLGENDMRYRVSYETMSGAQAAVFDAALLATLISRCSRLAVLPLELDAMSPSTATMLLAALAEHAPAVQVLAATWQVLPRPAGWVEVEV